MDNNSLDDVSKSSKENSSKEFGTSQSSLKSTKSLEKTSASSNLIKHEKNSIHFKSDHLNETDNQKSPLVAPDVASLKVPHKIIQNWRQACDRTKDKTKDLLKRWRTLPEFEAEHAKHTTRQTADSMAEKMKNDHPTESCGWSVHVWTTWVDRFSIDSELTDDKDAYELTPVQTVKLSHYFTALLDHDQDNLISEQDFEMFIERLRHFADWSINSTEFNILREVERGFIETFLHNVSDERLGFQVNDLTYITKEGWLHKWSELIGGSRNLSDFPVWLQFFVKVLFQVINRSGTGLITRDELGSFYSSVLCLDTVRVGEILDLAYQAMTSNGDHPLQYRAYRLCFANYLLGRYPNGPGQYILGAPPNAMSASMFPVDYSALNSQPEDLEQYAPDQKTNRHSVIV